MALLTIMGLFNYDPTIFENLYLPTGVDRQTAINHIVLETAELECVYPVPSFLKSAISLWSATRAMTWDRIYQASQLEYNPIENYDRQETETSTGTRAHSGKDTATHSGTEAHSGKDTTTISGTSQSNGLAKVAGFDSATMVDHDSTTGSATNAGNNELTHGEQIAESDTHELTHGEHIADSGSRTSRIHGNIGVTTSQQMLEQEMEIAPKLNIYDYIAEEFKKRFCILVY